MNRGSIFDAAADGDLATLEKRASSQNAKLDALDGNGLSCLHHAARWDHAAAITWLCAQGVDADLRSSAGTSALNLAA
jgi:hypothetical protein